MISIDLETSGLNPITDDILIVVAREGLNEYVWTNDNLEEAKEFIKNNSSKQFLGHYIKFDLSFIYSKFGILLENVHDTYVMYGLITNGLDCSLTLDTVLEEVLNVKLHNKKTMQKSFLNKKEVNEEQIEYAINDVKYLQDLYNKLIITINDYKLNKAYELERRLIPVLAKMEVTGVYIDSNKWRNLINKWKEREMNLKLLMDNELTKLNYKVPKREFKTLIKTDLFGNNTSLDLKTGINYSSFPTLKEIYSTIDNNLPVDSNDKISFNDEALNEYLLNNTKLYSFTKLLLELREYNKLIDTYGDKFLAKLLNNKIHTTYTQIFTKTARLSSQSPNLQNIPDKLEIKECFRARPGYKIITCDMSSAEIRIAADYSQDTLLLKNINEGLDLHSLLATDTLRIITNDNSVVISDSETPIVVKNVTIIPKKFRSAHKPVVFGFFYKAGSKKIYKTLYPYIKMFMNDPTCNTSPDVGIKIKEKLQSNLSNLNKFLDSVINTANTERPLGNKKMKYLRGILGHIRIFTNDAYAEAANYMIQNSNAVAMKLALVRIHNELKNLDANILLTVHDEIVVEANENILDEVINIVTTEMTKALEYVMINNTYCKVSYKVDNNWSK